MRPAVSCYERALLLLAHRSHFRRELERKLTSRGFAEADITEALDRLTEQGYLNEARVAEELVETRMRRGPEGRRRLVSELARRGASSEVIDATLDRSGQDELPLARQAAERWRSRGGKDPASLGRFLERKGFSSGTILRILEEPEGTTD